MKSTIINRIRYVRIFYSLTMLYFIIYNTIYGWNLLPENNTEKTFDDIFKFLVFFGIGWIISIGLDFMRLVVLYIINKTINE